MCGPSQLDKENTILENKLKKCLLIFIGFILSHKSFSTKN